MAIIEAVRLRATNRIIMGLMFAGVGSMFAIGIAAIAPTEAERARWRRAPLEKTAASIRFACTSPVYIEVGERRGIVPEDAKFFIKWIDREMIFYESYAGLRAEQDRQAMLEMYRKARAVYERLARPCAAVRRAGDESLA